MDWDAESKKGKAINWKGEESEQSKARRMRRADKLAGKGSTAGNMKKRRKYMNMRLDEIMSGKG